MQVHPLLGQGPFLQVVGLFRLLPSGKRRRHSRKAGNKHLLQQVRRSRGQCRTGHSDERPEQDVELPSEFRAKLQSPNHKELCSRGPGLFHETHLFGQQVLIFPVLPGSLPHNAERGLSA